MAGASRPAPGSAKPSATALSPRAGRARRWIWALALLVLLPVLLAVGLIAALWKGLHSEAGTRWWLEQAAAHVPGMQIEAPRGPLLGERAEFSLARCVVHVGRHTLRIDGLRSSGLQLVDGFAHAPYFHLQAKVLTAQRVAIESSPATEPATATAAPNDLRLPITARIDTLRIDELQLPGLTPPLKALSARLEAGSTHRVDALSARWNGLQAAGQLQIEAAAPMTLRARLDVRGEPPASDGPAGGALPAWARELTLALKADGPLARFDTKALLAMQAQRLDAQAQIAPFEALPLTQLDASFAQLDLSSLLEPLSVTDAPTTALSGTVRVQLHRDQPLEVRLQLSNAQPGRWDRRRAPLRELDLLARGRGGEWQIERARAVLASDEKTPAGVIEATGRYDDGRSEAALKLDGVLLQGLDERAPALWLTGPIGLTHTPPAAGTGGAALGKLGIDARLTGTLAQAPRKLAAPAPGKPTTPPALLEAVQLVLRGSLSPKQLTIDTLSARAGEARLDGQGRATREAERWNAEAGLKLAAFDPTLWLPGEPGAAWRRGRNVLNGQATLRAQWPAPSNKAANPTRANARAESAPPAPAPPAWLTALSGSLKAELSDSALAGQPLALSLQADADGRGTLNALAEARAADNRARLDLRLRSASPGRANATAPADDERLLIDVDAPALKGLSPITQALGLGPLGGKLRADARAEGPLGAWLFGGAATATLVTRGSLAVDGLQAAALQITNASGQWNLTLPGSASPATRTEPSGHAALQAKLEATGLRLPGLWVPTAALQLDGTLAEHRASLRAALRSPPSAPPALDGAKATGAPPKDTTGQPPEPATLTLQAQLSGAWKPGAAGMANVWTGRLQELALRPAASTAKPAAPLSADAALASTKPPAPAAAGEKSGEAAQPMPPEALPLVIVRDIDLQIETGPQSLRATVAPGRAEVLGAVLHWTRAGWQRSGEAPARMDLQAEVEPFRVAQLLQRLQPDFGWDGDLRMGAKVDVHSEPSVSAQVEITRSGGDLQVNELGTVQPLGLRELRLDLKAQDGLWRMTQVIDGETLGRLAGAQTVRTDAQHLWPPDDAPVEGAIRLQVEQLSTWGAWVPAGWRLGGTLDGVLRIAGRFGAPELIGELSGRELALRNALEGVALSNGELGARFEGGTARLDTLQFKAGDGTLRATGNARLGQDPQANLRLVAERATVLGRVDRRVVVSGEAAVKLDATTVHVDGTVRADEGLVDISRGDAPSLGDDVTVRRRSDVARNADAAPARAPRAVDLKLAVNLGERFRLRGRGIDTRLAGDLKLTTPNGKLTAYGEIRTERGTYEAYGQKLEIERGVITFVGDIANPRLDILAVRANTDTRVGVNVGGNTQSPRIRLFSDPELPSTEKLALLVTGRSYDSLGGTETLLLQRAAFALLAGDGGDGSRFDVARLLQLDELSVRQQDGAVRDTVVTLGKQISERVYVGYERGLNAAAGNWQLIYRIAQRFTLRAQSGEDPAVDLIWVFRWN